MRSRLLPACLVVLGLWPAAAVGSPPNEEWYGAQEVTARPFHAEIELASAGRDYDQFWDCLPDEHWPESMVEGVFADVWYRIEVTTQTRLMAIAELSDGAPIVGIYEQDGLELERRHCDYDQEPGEASSVGFWAVPGRPVFIQVGACITCGHPTLVTFELLEPVESDLAVHSLTVSRPTTNTPIGEQPEPLARDAAFVLENPSPEGSAIRGLWRLKACHEHDPGTEYCVLIDRGLASLAPGEQLSIAARWDATGSAGDFSICASVTPFDYVDVNYDNNKVTEKTWVLISNVPGESYLNYTGTFWTCHFRSYF
ncbi:MAG TPA: hypothetical protein VGB52_12665 [Actinomycetota bacterium]